MRSRKGQDGGMVEEDVEDGGGNGLELEEEEVEC